MTEQSPVTEVHFSEGLVGCPEWQHFALDRSADLAPLVLLVSTEHAGLALPAISPWLVKLDYAPQLSEADRAALQSQADADLEWLVVLNIQSDPPLMTANLLGPLVINRRTGLARQVVLSVSGYSAAHPVGVVAVAPVESEVSYARADTAP